MDDTGQYMHNTFWHEFQVTIIHQVKAELFSTLLDTIFPDEHPIFSKELFARFANLDGLKQFLKENYFTLTDFSVQHTLRRPGNHEADSSGLFGKYLFRTRNRDSDVLTMISFFHFAQESATPSLGENTTAEMPMPGGTGNAGGDGHGFMGGHITSRNSPVIPLVNLINANLDGDWNKVAGAIPVVAASPVWLCAATPPVPQGCPAIPPIPVPADASCSSSPGLWPITLQDVSPELESMTGDDVTVFILDTLPKPIEIKRAAEAAEKNNLLLLDVAGNVTFDYHILPDILDIPSPDQPVSGKDILGRDIGFRMPDHGFFIAGIVRDVAPNARIECVRILNDWCAGDMTTYIKALADIYDRMSQVDPNTGKAGDLYQKPVVINMSLNATPSEEEAKKFGLTEEIVRNSIRPFFQSLISLGAVIVASAGNEADIRMGAQAMDPSGIRPGPVLPGALADEGITEIIPVGALDGKGNPASYSCYPGPNGVATYGGEIPKPAEERSPDGMTVAKDIDALIGIYSALSYPALSLDDPHSRYPVPNTNAWAYWVGTSFATPIITAVAARVYELKSRGMDMDSVGQYIVKTVALPRPQSKWTRLDPKDYPPGTAPVHAIMALQCHPTKHKKKEEAGEIVEVHITEGNGRAEPDNVVAE
jgi:hypothetical protein